MSQSSLPQPTISQLPIRSRKAVSNVVPSADALVDYVSSGQSDVLSKIITSGQNKQIEAEVKRKVKIQIKKTGIANVVSQIYHCPPGSLHYSYFEELDHFDQEEEWGKLSGQETFALFVTLSPEIGPTSDQLLDSFSKMFGKSKKGILRAFWSIENAGRNGPRPHIHCVVVLDKTSQSGERAKVKAMIVRNLKGYKTKSEVYLQIKPVSEKRVSDKIAYVQGNKRDKDKLEFVEADKKWRQEVGYQDWYSFPETEIHTPLAGSL